VTDNKEPFKEPFMISTEDLAERWGLAPDTVRLWRKDNVGPPWIKLTPGKTGSVRYKMSDILEWEAKMQNYRSNEEDA